MNDWKWSDTKWGWGVLAWKAEALEEIQSQCQFVHQNWIFAARDLLLTAWDTATCTAFRKPKPSCPQNKHKYIAKETNLYARNPAASSLLLHGQRGRSFLRLWMRGVKQTTHLCTIPRLRMCGSIPPLSSIRINTLKWADGQIYHYLTP
jgi:hypothetical protein